MIGSWQSPVPYENPLIQRPSINSAFHFSWELFPRKTRHTEFLNFSRVPLFFGGSPLDCVQPACPPKRLRRRAAALGYAACCDPDNPIPAEHPQFSFSFHWHLRA
jgi:hypothetical protein